MTQVFLTSASSSPYAKPGDWQDSGAVIDLVGTGSSGSVGSVGANPKGGNGGGASALNHLTSGTLAASTPFTVPSAEGQVSIWENTASTNSYSSSGTNGTPPQTWTSTLGASAPGGSNATTNRGGCSGAGAATPTAAAIAGVAVSGTGGAGGSGCGGGSAGGTGGTPTFGAGGNGPGGTGGGASSNASGTAGTGGGGAGGTAVASGSAGTAGAGSAYTTSGPWDATHGPGAGGGGGGQVTTNVAGETSNGGAGGNYGGGGGGAGGLRGTGSQTAGTFGAGIIVITYTPVAAGKAFPPFVGPRKFWTRRYG